MFELPLKIHILENYFAFITRQVVAGKVLQIDRVGPADNRPSTDQLHHLIFNRAGPKAGSIHSIDLSVCVSVCLSAILSRPKAFIVFH